MLSRTIRNPRTSYHHLIVIQFVAHAVPDIVIDNEIKFVVSNAAQRKFSLKIASISR